MWSIAIILSILLLLWSIYYRNWWNDWKVNSVASCCIWRKRNHLILIQGNQPWYQLEGLVLKLKLQWFGHLMGRANSLEKTLMLGKIEGKRRRGWQRMRWHHWLNGHEFEQSEGESEGQGSLACCRSWSQKNHTRLGSNSNNKPFDGYLHHGLNFDSILLSY